MVKGGFILKNQKDLPAAYHGTGWQPRNKSLSQELSEGNLWAAYCSNSEWTPLKAVLLYIPPPDTPEVEDVNMIQHLHPINFTLLNKQMNNLSKIYQNFGIQVCVIKPAPVPKETSYPMMFYNLMYARDTFFMTPEGAVVSRMASEVRAGEERYVSKTLADLGIPILRTISGTGTFEGADAFWLDAKHVLVGTEKRTNQEGFRQLAACLEFQGVETLQIPLPKHTRTQHLMGVLQIVDKDLALIRSELVPDEVILRIERYGFHLIKMNETEEIKKNQAMNIVTIAPRKIVMVANNPLTKRIYEDHGIEVAAEAEVSELIKGAGGLGCATGILQRKLLVRST